MRHAPSGLTIDDHRALGDTLREVREALLGVRQVVSDGLGSGTPEYSAVSLVLRDVKRLEQALSLEAVGAHVDRMPIARLRALYGNENPQSEDPS